MNLVTDRRNARKFVAYSDARQLIRNIQHELSDPSEWSFLIVERGSRFYVRVQGEYELGYFGN